MELTPNFEDLARVLTARMLNARERNTVAHDVVFTLLHPFLLLLVIHSTLCIQKYVSYYVSLVSAHLIGELLVLITRQRKQFL